MKNRWIPDMDLYKIKVNKKGSYNNISRVKNKVFNSYIDYLNFSNIFPNKRQITKSAYSSKKKNIYLNNKLLKSGTSSNSEEKIKRNNLHIRCVEDNVLLNKEGNILDDLLNNKYLKPILESQDIDEKLLNCNLKEPVKNNFNVSLNDFFNRRKKYYMNFKTPKPEFNRIRDLSINTHNLNNSNNFYDNSGFLVHNKTMENTYANQSMNRKSNNNYYNDIKMTNNFYNNYNKNEISIINNEPYYNNNIKINNICSSAVRKKLKKYFSNTNSNERNNYNNEIKSPDLHFFKSQTYTQNENSFSENLYKYKNKKNKIIKNKEINIRNLSNNNLNQEKTDEIKEEDNMNKKYNDIKNIIKHNNKYDYSKKLFDIYRGKLIKEFLKHIQKGINKYLLNIFNYFIKRIQYKKNSKKIDEIFIPKIHLEKPNKEIVRESENISKSPFLQIFNSDKKNYQRYTNNINNRITEFKRYKNNVKINNSAIISNQRIIENNNILIKTNRNSMIVDENKNNIQIIKLNPNNTTNNSGLVYKKKKLIKNNMHIKKNDILSNSKGKIIDIDINLGKPIREINDINIIENGLFMNNYNISKKKFKSSLSTNKREKRKIKNKSKKKKLSLPKKKYLEEISSSSSDKDNFSSDKNISNNNNNSFVKNITNKNFTIKTNNNIIQPLIYKTSRINNKNENYIRNISEKNIVTSDKRLFININYISNLSYDNKLRSKLKYKNNSLTIKRNIYFPIFSQKVLKNKTVSNNYLFISNNRNSNLETQNKKMNMTNYINNDKNKYLNSCVKFIIKNINKVFLEKSFNFFLKRVKMIPKVNKIVLKKNRINAYVKKIGKTKN